MRPMRSSAVTSRSFYPDEQVAAGVPERILESARREGRYEAEGWRVRKDGSQFWADVVITALRDEDGQLAGFGKVTRDLTSRQLAIEQLRTAAAELRDGQRRAGAVPPADHERARLRDLRAGRRRPHPDLERRRRAHQGLRRRRGDRPPLRAVLHRGGSRPQASGVRAGGRVARGPLRGGRLARPQGRDAVLGQRRDHRPARRRRHAGRVRQGDARPHRASRGPAAARGVRAPRRARKPSGSGAGARRWNRSAARSSRGWTCARSSRRRPMPERA